MAPSSLARSAAAAGLLALASCASVSFERETQTSGTFEATGLAVTILSWDIPKSALNIARENASDARQPNMQVVDATVGPHLGPVDWLLDVLGVRWAKVSGTWGFPPRESPPEPPPPPAAAG